LPSFDDIQLDIGNGWFSVGYSLVQSGNGYYAVVVGYTDVCPGFRLVDYDSGYQNGIKTIYNKYTNSGSGGGC
jgi:hypothetical protein